MRFSLVPPRRYDPEILDRPDNSDAALREAFCDISRVNRWLGGIGSLWRPLRSIVSRRGLREFTLLDVGAGGADVPRAVVERAAGIGITARAAGLDRDPAILRYARSQSRRTSSPVRNASPPRPDERDPRHGRGRVSDFAEAPSAAKRPAVLEIVPGTSIEPRSLVLVCGDALRLPFADASFDFVTSSLMAHHFSEQDVSRLLAEMSRVARHAVLLNDLARHLVPWLGIRAFGPLLKSPMVRHDGPLSVLRGWTREELLACAREAGLGDRATVERRFPYRLVLIVTRDASPRPMGTSLSSRSQDHVHAVPGSTRRGASRMIFTRADALVQRSGSAS